jgi:hypothetical protein
VVQMMCKTKEDGVLIAYLCYAAFVGPYLVLWSCGRVLFCCVFLAKMLRLCYGNGPCYQRSYLLIIHVVYYVKCTGLILHIRKGHYLMICQYNE